MKQAMSLAEFRDEFRDCYGELSTLEVTRNRDLTQYLHWLEMRVLIPLRPLIMRGVVNHFRCLLSEQELGRSPRLAIKLAQIERRLDPHGSPEPPRSLKFRVIEVEQVPIEALGLPDPPDSPET